MMTIEQIVIDYLKENGYDGLYNSYRECGCGLGEFFSRCGAESCGDCEPAYAHKVKECKKCPEPCNLEDWANDDDVFFCGKKEVL